VPAPAEPFFRLAKNLREQTTKDARWCGLDVIDANERLLDLHSLRASAATVEAAGIADCPAAGAARVAES
jgi:hypothetical protein